MRFRKDFRYSKRSSKNREREIQVSQVSRELLAKELDQLRPLAELIDLDVSV